MSRRLLDAGKRQVEHERRVGRNRPTARASVRELGRNHEPALATNAHPDHALVPAANHAPSSKLEADAVRFGNADGNVLPRQLSAADSIDGKAARDAHNDPSSFINS